MRQPYLAVSDPLSYNTLHTLGIHSLSLDATRWEILRKGNHEHRSLAGGAPISGFSLAGRPLNKSWYKQTGLHIGLVGWLTRGGRYAITPFCTGETPYHSQRLGR